jgi:small GTP-binding protein
LTWSVSDLADNISYLFKLVFLGEGAVGKTSLVGRYVYDSFEGDYLATIGTDIHVKTVQVDETMVKLVVWDIAGQDDFAQLRKAYYQNASGAFFIVWCDEADSISTPREQDRPEEQD